MGVRFCQCSGGTIYIGIRDVGTVVGISDGKRLMEDIPNKIKDTMGIIADVNLLNQSGLEYIEIKVSPRKSGVHHRDRALYQQ